MELLSKCRYTFSNYHNYDKTERCVVLRHDVDTSLPQALRLAEFEASLGIQSTYFILFRTDFYNPASIAGQAAIQRIHSLGHEIGLHFDEKFYLNSTIPMEELITQESKQLSMLCGLPITTVSMHRPSLTTLDANLQIPGLINSYGRIFFHDFKYLSDSRRHWREPVEDIIRSGEHKRLHIVTHAFWYHDQNESIEDTVSKFVLAANKERYWQMAENIKDISSILPPKRDFVI